MAGLAFTKGLFYKYQGEPMNALKELNIARFDTYFGESAISNMIEIYLNPLNEMIFSSVEEAQYTTTPDNITATMQLIQELNNRGIDTNLTECNAMIHSK